MEYTEDDTFKALKRISIQELEGRIGSHLIDLLRHELKTMRYSMRQNEGVYKRSTLLKRWIPFYLQPISLFNSSSVYIGVKINGLGWEPLFEKTGWTPEEYVAELNKIFDKEYDEDKKQKRIRSRNKALGAFISGCVAGVTFWLLYPATASFWLSMIAGQVIGITCGVLLSKKGLPF